MIRGDSDVFGKGSAPDAHSLLVEHVSRTVFSPNSGAIAKRQLAQERYRAGTELHTRGFGARSAAQLPWTIVQLQAGGFAKARHARLRRRKQIMIHSAQTAQNAGDKYVGPGWKGACFCQQVKIRF